MIILKFKKIGYIKNSQIERLLTVSRYARKAYKNNIYRIEPIFKKKSLIFLENRLNP